MDLPTRRQLPHAVPDFVRSGEIYFLTICGRPRGSNQFATAAAWSAILAATRNYHDRSRWYCRLLLAMPDHVHLLASFPPHEVMKRVVTGWKHYLAANAALSWQRDFFDHRVRDHESYSEKGAYIRANPFRAGLVARAVEWKFVWAPTDLLATPLS